VACSMCKGERSAHASGSCSWVALKQGGERTRCEGGTQDGMHVLAGERRVTMFRAVHCVHMLLPLVLTSRAV
jgi:hypothetical protein